MHVFEIKNTELVDELSKQVEEAGITSAAITLIGATDTFRISTMPVHDAFDDIISTYEMPAEFHGTGEVVDGKVHLHGTFAVQGDRAYAGHVHSAMVGAWFVRAYVQPVD